MSDDGPAWAVLADLLMPGVARTDIVRDSGNVQWLVNRDGSWAYHETATGEVEQGGPMRLWDQLEHIHGLWNENGQPTRDHVGITVTTTGEHRIWLNDESNTIELRDAG